MEVGVILKGKVKSNLGTILEERGLRFKWVADKIEATQPQLTNWCKNDENGYARSTPGTLYLIRLEKLLGLRVGEMFEEVE
jgi:hypothetical protein